MGLAALTGHSDQCLAALVTPPLKVLICVFKDNPCIDHPFPWLAHAAFDGFTVALDEFSKLFGRRKRDQITRDEELIIQTCGCELNLRLIFGAAKDDADGRIVLGSHDLLFEIIEVIIHLRRVPMAEWSDLEIHQDMAAKKPMVKYQVDKVVLIADGNSFLSSFKTKAGAEL
jgi:hypothetical protein